MSKSIKKGKKIIALLEEGRSVSETKAIVAEDNDQWFRYSSKAYSIKIEQEKQVHIIRARERNSKGNFTDGAAQVLSVNNRLADYALLISIFFTVSEFKQIQSLVNNLPNSMPEMINAIEKFSMEPKIRASQKLGRFEAIPHFAPFVRLIDAATFSFYRGNFISCYLTLVPVVEGTLHRWMGYDENTGKPDFEKVRKFFKNSHTRQPCPANILFHDVFVKTCDKILNEHFYKPTDTGNAYANFNRHVASHLLYNDISATRENCIRLFVLIDTMTEIYVYESMASDPRFELTIEQISSYFYLLTRIKSEYSLEQEILN